jgi:hypothetical protein
MTTAQMSQNVSGPFRARRPTPIGWVVVAILVIISVSAVTYFRDRHRRFEVVPVEQVPLRLEVRA